MNFTAARFIPSPGGEPIGLGLAVSLLAHVTLAAVIVFWPSGGFERTDLFVPTYNVRLVGAPSPSPAPAPAAAKPAPKPAPAAKPEPKPTPKPVAKPKPQPKPKEAIATKETAKPKRVKPQAKTEEPKVDENLLNKRLARLKAQVSSERRVDSAIDRLEQRVAGRGAAATAAAGAGVGGGGKASSLLDAYQSEIWARLREHWYPPMALGNSIQGLMTTLVVRIRRDGTVEKVWVEKSSGNERYDQTTLRAVQSASPFPRMPAGLHQSILELGFHFRPEDSKS